MSQPQKVEVELKEEDRKLLRSAIEAATRAKTDAEKFVEDLAHGKIPQAAEEAKPKGHQTPEEMAACPNCYPKIKPIVLKQYAEELKGQEIVKCKGCGLSVKRSEEKCPACGISEAE